MSCSISLSSLLSCIVSRAIRTFERQYITYFLKAIELEPNFGLAWINKGFALYSEGYLLESSKKYDESIRCFDNAIDTNRMKAQKELGDLAKNIDNLLEIRYAHMKVVHYKKVHLEDTT
jgi:tetratricopeptide (TPR) repeat protein